MFCSKHYLCCLRPSIISKTNSFDSSFFSFFLIHFFISIFMIQGGRLTKCVDLLIHQWHCVVIYCRYSSAKKTSNLHCSLNIYAVTPRTADLCLTCLLFSLTFIRNSAFCLNPLMCASCKIYDPFNNHGQCTWKIT